MTNVIQLNRQTEQGQSPTETLLKASELNPRLAVVLLIDDKGNQVTLCSQMKPEDLTFMSASFQAQVLDMLRPDPQ